MRRVVSALLLSALLSTFSGAQAADEVRAGGVAASQAWARATAGNTPTGAAYVTLRNDGREADRLIGARTPAAAKAELHIHQKDGEIMRMRPVDAVELPAGATAAMGPGGLHIMLLELKAPLKQGDRLPLTLRFERAGEVTVEVQVLGVGAAAPAAAPPPVGHGHGR